MYDRIIVITIKNDIQNRYTSHEELAELSTKFNRYEDFCEIYLDFSNISFIASNQFAVLGCILETYLDQHSNSQVYFRNLKSNLKKTIQKNGFYSHLGLKKRPDRYNTVIPYTIFDIDKIFEFEKYIVLKIFNRSDIPPMSDKKKNAIIDYFLEIFNNAKEHTHSKKIYTCGQYFHQKKLLYFTIVDAGETIPYNVKKFFSRMSSKAPDKTLEWAIESGNSTRVSSSPGGLGLSLIKEFIQENHGFFLHCIWKRNL